MKGLLVASAFAALWSNLSFAEPQPANAAYYADCLAAAATAKSFDRSGRYPRFACYGPSAEAFFEALGRRSPDVAYEEQHEGSLFHFTQKPVKDSTGLDYCKRSPGSPAAEMFSCVLIFPAGSFLDR